MPVNKEITVQALLPLAGDKAPWQISLEKKNEVTLSSDTVLELMSGLTFWLGGIVTSL